jgi:hypothetical protein
MALSILDGNGEGEERKVGGLFQPSYSTLFGTKCGILRISHGPTKHGTCQCQQMCHLPKKCHPTNIGKKRRAYPHILLLTIIPTKISFAKNCQMMALGCDVMIAIPLIIPSAAADVGQREHH